MHSICKFEKAEVMVPEDESKPEIFAEFEKELGIKIEGLGRYEFYNKAGESEVMLAISTGEVRTYANVLLTVGCA